MLVTSTALGKTECSYKGYCLESCTGLVPRHTMTFDENLKYFMKLFLKKLKTLLVEIIEKTKARENACMEDFNAVQIPTKEQFNNGINMTSSPKKRKYNEISNPTNNIALPPKKKMARKV